MLFEVYLCGVCIHAANNLFHIESLRVRKKFTRDRSGQATITKELEHYADNMLWSPLWPVDMLRKGWEIIKTEF